MLEERTHMRQATSLSVFKPALKSCLLPLLSTPRKMLNLSDVAFCICLLMFHSCFMPFNLFCSDFKCVSRVSCALFLLHSAPLWLLQSALKTKLDWAGSWSKHNEQFQTKVQDFLEPLCGTKHPLFCPPNYIRLDVIYYPRGVFSLAEKFIYTP